MIKVFRFLTLCTALVFMSNSSILAFDFIIETYLDDNCNGVRDPGEPLYDGTLDPVTVDLNYCEDAAVPATIPLTDPVCGGDLVSSIKFNPTGVCRTVSANSAPQYSTLTSTPVTGPSLSHCIMVILNTPPGQVYNDHHSFYVCVNVTGVPMGYTLGGWESFAPDCTVPANCTKFIPIGGFSGQETNVRNSGEYFFDFGHPGNTSTACIEVPFVLPGPKLSSVLSTSTPAFRRRL